MKDKNQINLRNMLDDLFERLDYMQQLLFSLNDADRRIIEEKLKEKDKEIERLNKFYDLTHKVLDDNVKLIFNTKQLAIQELEKAKVKLRAKLHLLESGYLRHFVAWRDICDQINQQIKQLKG